MNVSIQPNQNNNKDTIPYHAHLELKTVNVDGRSHFEVPVYVTHRGE